MGRKYTVRRRFRPASYFTDMQRYLIIFLLFVVGVIFTFNFVLGFVRRMTNTRDSKKP